MISQEVNIILNNLSLWKIVYNEYLYISMIIILQNFGKTFEPNIICSMYCASK